MKKLSTNVVFIKINKKSFAIVGEDKRSLRN